MFTVKGNKGVAGEEGQCFELPSQEAAKTEHISRVPLRPDKPGAAMSATSATSDPAHKVASAGTASVGGHEIGYPHGHLGHLSADEEDAFRNFKLFLQEKGLYEPGPPASHDDQTLM